MGQHDSARIEYKSVFGIVHVVNDSDMKIVIEPVIIILPYISVSNNRIIQILAIAFFLSYIDCDLSLWSLNCVFWSVF